MLNRLRKHFRRSRYTQTSVGVWTVEGHGSPLSDGWAADMGLDYNISGWKIPDAFSKHQRVREVIEAMRVNLPDASASHGSPFHASAYVKPTGGAKWRRISAEGQTASEAVENLNTLLIAQSLEGALAAFGQLESSPMTYGLLSTDHGVWPADTNTIPFTTRLR